MGLVAEEIQKRGIPTVTLSMERGIQAQRVAHVPFLYNFPLGGPWDTERHEEVALAALGLLQAEPGEHDLPFKWR